MSFYVKKLHYLFMINQKKNETHKVVVKNIWINVKLHTVLLNLSQTYYFLSSI